MATKPKKQAVAAPYSIKPAMTAMVTVAESVEAVAQPIVAAPAALPEAAIEPAAVPMPTDGLQEFTGLSRDTISALTKSNLAFAEGAQAVGEEILDYLRHSFASASRTATALLQAKTLDEVIQLNTDLAKSNIELMMARSAKLSEIGINVANETLTPLGGRLEATLAKLTKPIAA